MIMHPFDIYYKFPVIVKDLNLSVLKLELYEDSDGDESGTGLRVSTDIDDKKVFKLSIGKRKFNPEIYLLPNGLKSSLYASVNIKQLEKQSCLVSSNLSIILDEFVHLKSGSFVCKQLFEGFLHEQFNKPWISNKGYLMAIESLNISEAFDLFYHLVECQLANSRIKTKYGVLSNDKILRVNFFNQGHSIYLLLSSLLFNFPRLWFASSSSRMPTQSELLRNYPLEDDPIFQGFIFQVIKYLGSILTKEQFELASTARDFTISNFPGVSQYFYCIAFSKDF